MDIEQLQEMMEERGWLTPEMRAPLPHMFMMEMLELNEQLLQLELMPNAKVASRFEEKVEGYLMRLGEEGAPYVERFVELGKDEVTELRENYYKQKYLLRIRERLLHLRPAHR